MGPWIDVQTFSSRWELAVQNYPLRTFLIFEASNGSVKEWTYASFDQLVNRVAHHLYELGVRQGSSVHLVLTNSPAFVAIWIATVRLGAWIVPSDPFGTSVELGEHISRTKPSVGIYSPSRRDNYLLAKPLMPVIEINEDDGDLEMIPHKSFSLWPKISPQDRAAVMFTSGTTGRPKGVVITQANYAFAGKTMSEASNLESHHRELVVLPLFHANAQYYSFASAIWAGASVALMHTFSASRFLQQAFNHQVTHASLFAAPIRMILARGNTPVAGLHLIHCWYAMNISAGQFDTLTNLLGCKPRQLYGMTETIPAVLTDSATDPNPSSMGQVTPGCEVAIHTTDHQVTAIGTIGEVVVRGERGITLFDGYLDDPTTTNSSFMDDWFLTGDRAFRDSNGLFFFDGRRQDILKVAGENVSTVEVEMVISSHPKILEAVVVGAPDLIRDEVPIAFAVATDLINPPSIEELMSWCNERLAKSKRPHSIIMLDELPRTSVGKIRKFILKDLAAQQHSQSNNKPKQGAFQ